MALVAGFVPEWASAFAFVASHAFGMEGRHGCGHQLVYRSLVTAGTGLLLCIRCNCRFTGVAIKTSLGTGLEKVVVATGVGTADMACVLDVENAVAAINMAVGTCLWLWCYGFIMVAGLTVTIRIVHCMVVMGKIVDSSLCVMAGGALLFVKLCLVSSNECFIKLCNVTTGAGWWILGIAGGVVAGTTLFIHGKGVIGVIEENFAAFIL